jgi:hypothetical protein
MLLRGVVVGESKGLQQLQGRFTGAVLIEHKRAQTCERQAERISFVRDAHQHQTHFVKLREDPTASIDSMPGLAGRSFALPPVR